MVYLNEDFDIEDHVLKHYNGTDESVRIPDSITSIGNGAFSNCRNLKRIVLPKGIKTIEDYIFNHCDHLKEIILPEGLVQIGTGAFNRCPAFQQRDISE